jgi:hypothetical protein
LKAIHNRENNAVLAGEVGNYKRKYNFEKPLQKLRISLSNGKAIFEVKDFVLHPSGKTVFNY